VPLVGYYWRRCGCARINAMSDLITVGETTRIPRTVTWSYISLLLGHEHHKMTLKVIKIIKSLKSKKRQEKSKRAVPELIEEECLVCLETGRCLSTSKCHHPICIDCIGPYVAITHHSRLPCPCPAAAICPEQFTLIDITPFVTEEQIFKIWLERAVKEIENGRGMYCPNPTCSKPILWSRKREKKAGGGGKCKHCKQPVCLRCKSIYHHLMTYIL
jgi:hypothetical protein